MITRTDYELNLFNGDMGFLLKRTQSSYLQKADEVVFNEGGHYRKLSALLAPPFEYAYCLSVHKSQGSEYDHVVLVVPKGAEVFGREILYTGVTRARQSIEVIGEYNVIESCIKKSSQKRSLLKMRLKL